MESFKGQNVLISGASIAGLSTAYWLHKVGYNVTVVEIANEPRTAGTAVDIREIAVETAKRMEVFDQLQSNKLGLEKIEFKDDNDVTQGTIALKAEENEPPSDDIEIERDVFIRILYNSLKDDVAFVFNDSITALHETADAIQVTFKTGPQRSFDLVFGCDGIHSGVRRLAFGNEAEYVHFLEAYFSVTIVNKSLIDPNTMQMYYVPGQGIMLNAYNNKTDIIFVFASDDEIPYNYRDVVQQRKIILDKFAGQRWRTAELLDEVQHSGNFYFDKFCQIKMPSWTKGRVALVGDAGYCASPAAGMGASLALQGAATLADALQKHHGNFASAFQEYNTSLRPFIEDVQAAAAQNIRENFIPRTEEAIRERIHRTEAL